MNRKCNRMNRGCHRMNRRVGHRRGTYRCRIRRINSARKEHKYEKIKAGTGKRPTHRSLLFILPPHASHGSVYNNRRVYAFPIRLHPPNPIDRWQHVGKHIVAQRPAPVYPRRHVNPICSSQQQTRPNAHRHLTRLVLRSARQRSKEHTQGVLSGLRSARAGDRKG